MSQKPRYMDKQSTQTLREGLAEYYAFNPHVTHPATQPTDFGKILLAHDVGHVIYGCQRPHAFRHGLEKVPHLTSLSTSRTTFKARVQDLPGRVRSPLL